MSFRVLSAADQTDGCKSLSYLILLHIRKLVDISPINTPLSHQLESYNTLKHLAKK